MKKIIFLTLIIPILAWVTAFAGEITSGSVPGSLNYQGRLERDNAPITGPIHLTFRIYTAPTGGSAVYTAPEIIVYAAQGIFSATITPPWTVFSNAGALYLEVQVESDVLSPREPLSSVAYALVAKKLEDGASVKIATLTTTGNVGIGTDATSDRLSVNGTIRLTGTSDSICFSNGTCMSSAGVGAAVGGVTSTVDSVLEADSDSNSTGEMIIKTTGVERIRIKNGSGGGAIGIGPGALAAPMGTVDIDGSLYVGNQGIYNRSGGSVTLSGLYVPDGGITGASSEYLSIGQTENVIALVSGGSERMRVHSNGNVGMGLANPLDNLHVAGDIASNTGVRGGQVSIGDYSTWTNLPNEVRSETGYDLLLQQTNSYNVGIGTDTPREKLHVKGSVRADQGIIAATASFSGAVNVGGDFTANSGNNRVFLSSTTIYGSLTVTGGVGSDKGLPAYLTDDNSFSGRNTFTGMVSISTDIIVTNRVGVGAISFNFAPSKYLQIGDNKPEFDSDDAAAYIVAGANADSKIFFYRGAVEAARLETQGAPANPALALVAGNTKSTVDSTYYRIYNSVVLISTGNSSVDTTTPAVYVSSSLGNVGMGTAILDSSNRLTVEGNIRISTTSSPGRSYGIIFADGTAMNTANPGGVSVGAVSNIDNAVVQSDSDGNSSGSVILRANSLDALVVNNGGNVGIGTLNPMGKLNVRGDLVLGTPSLISGASGAEDLFVGGNVVLDGGITQRSSAQNILGALKVSGDVYLSTTAAKTRVGSDTAPGYTLDVTGDINASGIFRTGGMQWMSAGRIMTNTTWNGSAVGVTYGGTGANLSASGGANQIVRQNSSGGAFTVSALADADIPDTITITDITQVANRAITDMSGTLAPLHGGSGADLSTTGGANQIVRQSSSGGAFTVSALADADIPDTITITDITQVANRAITDMSGTLAPLHGGSGADLSTTGGANQIVRQSSSGGAFTVSALADADIPDSITLTDITQVTNRAITDMSGTLGVDHGGTGGTTFTQNGVLYGNNAAGINVTAQGAVNTVLRGTGGAPAFGTIDSNYTTGASGSFDVATTTTTPAQCKLLTITNGLITAIGLSHNCD